jgi:hypothetical protein
MFPVAQYGILVKYEVVFAALILLWVYFLIAFEIVHRTVAGAVGAFSALVLLWLLSSSAFLSVSVWWMELEGS